MGGLTYLFAFILNCVIAVILAGLIAVVVTLFPSRREAEGINGKPTSRKRRAIISFIGVWLFFMLYGCVDMFRTHHDELSKFEGASIIPGLIDSEAQVLRAERVVQGDSAQSYLMVLTTADDVERIAKIQKMKPAAYDGHTVRKRGWPVPEWWPATDCKDGVTYNVDPFDTPSPDMIYTLNWCPIEKKAFIQNFDY